MKKTILSAVIIFLLTCSLQAQMFTYSSGYVNFFSKTKLEDIDARNSSPKVLLQIVEKKIAIIAENSAFKFQNKLMEEHYNEKYVESEKYPLAKFQGTINENVDLTKDGEYKVTVTGNLMLHGVVKERTIPGIITVKGNEIHVKASFKIACSEHNITIPSIIGANVADDVDVTVDVILIPKK